MKYVLHKNPVAPWQEDKDKEHARVARNSKMNMEKLCRLISARSSLSSADVKGVLDSFRFFMTISLMDGESVELEELGLFYPTLKTRTYIDENGKEQFDIKVATVGFRCDPKLKKEVRLAHLEEVKMPKRKLFSFEQRKERIVSYIGKHLMITSTEVMGLNGCTRHRALSDLKKLMSENTLCRSRVGKSAVYFFPPE